MRGDRHIGALFLRRLMQLDERKSWKRLIFAYAGAGLLVLVIAFFFARGAAHDSTIVAHSASSPTPGVVGVYSGIAPDATAPPAAATDARTPSPAPSQSASPGPHPSPAAKPSDAKAAFVAAAAAARKHSAAKNRVKQMIADADPEPSAAPKTAVESSPVVVEQATEAPAPPPAATEAPQANAPIFAPQRVVDAQVRVAIQPEYTEMDRERGAHGTSVVLVTIDPKGNVVSAVVGTSSGYSSLDREAMTAARSSQFVAPRINGHPATETYRVVYDFAP
jgi:TonB family protein